ncbi:MAG: DUF3052 family protein [Ignavibacteriales bacterium]|nr:DUF3052 family protein [Ignavibacteriales bacterium]
MGTEVTTKVTIGTERTEAKVLLETNAIIIRGPLKMTIPFSDMKSLASKNGLLSFSVKGKKVAISVGEKAGKWLEKIKNPKSVLDKLGVTTDSKVSVINFKDENFLIDIQKKADAVALGKAAKDSDLIFYEANSRKEVEQLSSLKKYLKPNGGIWVLSLKGKLATIKDIEIMKIGKKCGLVDTKVVGFSETHTALKFVIPLSQR